MLHIPFYNPTKSYEENYEKGPFGDFADGKVFKDKSKPKVDFHGQKVFLPFGIPAGPIINSNFVKGAFDKGFDIVVYKTVRTDFYPCHPYPNVLSVNVEGDLTIEKSKEKLVADNKYHEPLSITNSFGVPSKTPDVWQQDVKKAISYEKEGQVLVLSFMGTVRTNQSQEEFIEDYALGARLSLETGAKILEVNLSCPNIGNEGLVCYNTKVTEMVCDAIKNEIGNKPLILKIGYFEEDEKLLEIAKIANKYANGIAAVNTIQSEIVDNEGNQALPGKMRNKSGVCGAAIKWAGMEMAKRLKEIRDENGFKFSIEGVGGVMDSSDYFDYVRSGADSVMSATGAIWNPYLAQKIKESENKARDIIDSWPKQIA